MKKLASIMLALTLVLGMSTVAFAATPTSSDEKTFTFEKRYETTAGKTPAEFPAEVLEFEVVAGDNNPDDTMITIADHTVASNPGNVVVTVPSYDTVGKYNYTVSEVAGDTQGVTYATNSFGVQVLVAYDAQGNLVATTSFTTSDGKEGKIDEIVNKYDLGELAITKEVSGNLASTSQLFDIDVTFTSDKPVKSDITGAETITADEWELVDGIYTVTKTITVSLSNGETATFWNIPAGVEYTIAEQDKHFAEDTNGSNPATGYEATYDDAKDGTIVRDTTAETTVLNTKGTEIETGIGTDSLPYMLLLAVAFVGIVAFFGRRRIAR